MAEAVPAFTPVNLLTGFLGSGKTTLLRRLLASPELAGTAVLINEFGEVGLDHQLVERIDETVVLLRSGCLCCTIRGELARAMRDLHSRRERGDVPPFARLMVESSGLADPLPILTTLKADPVLRHHFRAGEVITTVDTVNGLSQIERHREPGRQIAVADRLVLTKTDLARPAHCLAEAVPQPDFAHGQRVTKRMSPATWRGSVLLA
jgi:G3E family GTPase